MATLMLEVLDSRLLSVLAWYHLSFFAVSVAMLGLSAGAILIFVAGDRRPWSRPQALPRLAGAFGAALALAHLVNLAIPFPPVRVAAVSDLLALAGATTALTLPFVVSGMVVTLALTRTGAPIGRLYGADLLGAAAGCLGVIALLNLLDATSAAFVVAGVAAVGGWAFARAFGRRGGGLVAIACVLLAAAGLNARAAHPLGVMYPKNRSVWPLLRTVEHAVWNSHSFVMVRRPEPSQAWLWGPGTHAPETPATVAWSMIDGEAGTPITKWDGQPASLDWVQYDVTSLPYRLRHGRVGVIGVGGGRDLLTAIWAGNPEITGIEVNRTFIRLLTGPYRQFAGVADYPGVTLVNDEARSFLTRTRGRFDILQMSLIDTWASTGAGAFTLTENGLYTREGWRVFLRALTPDGVLGVSRWYAPGAVSESTRLLSLGVAALIDAGVPSPSRHVILASAGHVATLMISPAPFSDDDRSALEAAARAAGFTIQVSPWTRPVQDQLGRVASVATLGELQRAVANPDFDFSPPTDARPFFFNVLTLHGVMDGAAASLPEGGIIRGNLVATSTLLTLLGIATLLVLAIIAWPLAATGRPSMPLGPFLWGLLYFALIGCGFMFIQIPFLQRFSVYLGHPTYTFSIILFLMIVAAGTGSLCSERLPADRAATFVVLSVATGAAIAVEALLLQPAMETTVGWALAGRTAVVALFVVPLAAALGLCFPLGMRLVAHASGGSAPPGASPVTAWYWGVNGACGVLASIVAVTVSVWLGIQVNLWIAAGLYVLLGVPAGRLARA